jgi:hypothetical protein
MHFGMKNYLKNNRYYTTKHSLNRMIYSLISKYMPKKKRVDHNPFPMAKKIIINLP